MTEAVLRFEGMEQLHGTAEIGGDYVRLLVDARNGTSDFTPAARGEIEVDGKTSEVVLENASMAVDPDSGIVLTMRLIKPIG